MFLSLTEKYLFLLVIAVQEEGKIEFNTFANLINDTYRETPVSDECYSNAIFGQSSASMWELTSAKAISPMLAFQWHRTMGCGAVEASSFPTQICVEICTNMCGNLHKYVWKSAQICVEICTDIHKFAQICECK